MEWENSPYLMTRRTEESSRMVSLMDMAFWNSQMAPSMLFIFFVLEIYSGLSYLVAALWFPSLLANCHI